MGKGVCSRRQRKIFQSFLLITIVCGTLYAFMISYEMHKQLKKTEAMAVKYQQHQESLSAQLQVVYEHRSRLEKSLQKERLEHKKAKEDYLVYKLESQQTLNKEKQDSTNRLNSLQSQHHILKSQHEDLKTQYYELQEKHQYQGEDHDRALDQHRVEMDHMQRAKEVEISRLKENAYNLREENRQLRKAHQDIHTQLLDVRQQHKDLKTSKDHLTLTLEDHKSALAVAQLQVEELKRLKGTLVKKPSVNQADQSRRPVPPQAQSHRVGAPEHRPSPEREPDHTHDQKNTQVGHQTEKEPRISHHAVQGVAKMGIDREAVKASKPAQQAETPAEGRGEEEKKMQKERKEEERRRPDPEHAILYPNELGKEPGHGQSLRHEKQQTVTEQLLLLKKQIETLDSDIAKEGDMHPHHNEGEKGDVKDIQNPEKGLREREEDVNPEDDPNNQGEDEFEEAEEQQDEMEPAERPDHRPAGSQERPAEDEQLVVLDDVVDPGKQRKEEVESEDDPYSEENGDQGTWNEDTNPNKQQETRIDHKANREENYKEEDEMAEEEEGPRDIYANQRAEM